MLLEQGANVNQLDSCCKTALYKVLGQIDIQLMESVVQIFHFLVRNGAQQDLKSRFGITAQHLARTHVSSELRMLLDSARNDSLVIPSLAPERYGCPYHLYW